VPKIPTNKSPKAQVFQIKSNKSWTSLQHRSVNTRNGFWRKPRRGV